MPSNAGPPISLLGVPADTSLICDLPVLGTWGFCKCKEGYGLAASERLCQQCPAGHYRPFSNVNQICVFCPLNTYCTTLGTIVPIMCPLGTVSSAGATSYRACVPCASGSFRESFSDQDCQLCPAHHSCPKNGTVTPQACALGSISASVGAIACILCPVGTFSNGLECEVCPAMTVCSKKVLREILCILMSLLIQYLAVKLLIPTNFH